MGANMNEDDRKLLQEIHEKLIGTLDDQGFIGRVEQKFVEMNSRIVQLEGWKKTNVGIIVTIVGMVIAKILGLDV